MGGVLGAGEESEPDEAKVKLAARELSVLGVGGLGDALRENGRRGGMVARTPEIQEICSGDRRKHRMSGEERRTRRRRETTESPVYK